MANRLKMAEQQAIIGLVRLGWSYRRIAAELGIDRETVSRHVRAAAAAGVPPGTGGGPNAANVITGSTGLAAGSSAGGVRAGPGGAGAAGSGDTAANAAISIAGSTKLAAGGSAGLAAGGPGAGEGIDTAGHVGGAAAPDSNAAISITGNSAGFSGVEWPSGSCGTAGEKPALPSDDPALPAPPWQPGRRSRCEPWRSFIVAGLERGLTAQRIWQDLVAERGFDGDYQSVQRFVRKLGRSSPLPFRRMECAPGAEAQVDFGRGAPIVDPKGKRSRPHLFRIVLSHSRKAYSEVVPRQTTEVFPRCIENAFWHFGGATRTLVPDNLKAAVLRADWHDPELNPKIQAFAAHYGMAVLPTRPRTPRHKGKVERGVGYAQGNALKGREFPSLAAQNRFLAEWEADVADTRIHGTTRKQVGQVFREVEKAALLPLPPARFPSFQEGRRSVNRDGHVEVARAYYSAPPEFVGRTLWARWDGQVVRLFDERMNQVAIHVRKEPGRFSTDERHIAPQKRSGVERGAAWWLGKAHAVGPFAGRWADGLLTGRGIHGLRAVMGLVGLTQRHPADAVERACQVALSHGAGRLRDVRNLLKRGEPAAEQQRFEFAAEHPLIRPLADYGRIVAAAFDNTPVRHHSSDAQPARPNSTCVPFSTPIPFSGDPS